MIKIRPKGPWTIHKCGDGPTTISFYEQGQKVCQVIMDTENAYMKFRLFALSVSVATYQLNFQRSSRLQLVQKLAS